MTELLLQRDVEIWALGAYVRLVGPELLQLEQLLVLRHKEMLPVFQRLILQICRKIEKISWLASWKIETVK